MRVQAKLAVYGYPESSNARRDYTTKYYECDLYFIGRRLLKEAKCTTTRPWISEPLIRRLTEGVSFRLIAGKKDFTHALIGTVKVGMRPERYAEVRKVNLTRPMDLSLLNVHNLGITTGLIVPERMYEELDESIAAVVSAVLRGEPLIVYAPREKVNKPSRHVTILRYLPSYALKLVSLNTNAKANDEELVKVIPTTGSDSIEVNGEYGMILLKVPDPIELREFVDDILYRVNPDRNMLSLVADSAAVYFYSKYSRREVIEKLLNERIARGLGLITKHVMPEFSLLAAKLVLEKGYESEFLAGAEGDEKAIDALMLLAYEEYAERGDYSKALRVVRKIFPYKPGSAIMLLYDIYLKGQSAAPKIRDVLVSLLASGIKIDELSDEDLSTLLYLCKRVNVPEAVIEPYVKDIVRKACEIYEEVYSNNSKFYIDYRPALSVLFGMIFSTLPAVEGIEKDPKIRKVIREVLENLRQELTYSRYEIKRFYESYVKGIGIPPLVIIPNDMMPEYINEILRRIASDDFFYYYFPLPRSERLEKFAPEMLSEFEKIAKNLIDLRQEILSYIRKRESEGPREGEGEEIM